MALRVLVVPEDFRKDQYILKPIVERIFESLGVITRVEVCRDPLLGGVSQAMNWEKLQDILDRYKGMIQVFLLIVDRDGLPDRRRALDNLEERAREYLSDRPRCVMLAENAWQEVEVWVLAGLADLPKQWLWADVRAERDPKERYYDEVVRKRGLKMAPFEGRAELAREAAGNYRRIAQLCPEDIGVLEKRLKKALEAFSL